jgi:hypothetical protein
MNIIFIQEFLLKIETNRETLIDIGKEKGKRIEKIIIELIE